MKRLVSSVGVGVIGALVGSFVALGAASPCLGQANVPTNGRPWFYLWGPPMPKDWGYTVTAFASQMVRVQAAQPAAQAAFFAAKWQEDQINDGTTDPAKVCIELQNFGQLLPASNPYNSFYHELDKLNPLPIWNPNPPEYVEMPYMQFWIEHGRAQAKDWMDAFLAAYEVERLARGLLAPARFHFDMEIGLFGCCEKNYVLLAEAMAADPRWGDDAATAKRVKGTKDYLYPSADDKYLSVLWAEAKQAFGWDPTKTLQDVLQATQFGNNDPNRGVFLWLGEINQRATDAAMKECAYDRITTFYTNLNIPAPL